MKVLCGAATALTCVGAVVSLAASSSAAAGPDPRTLGPSFVYDDAYSEVLTAVTVRATQRSTKVTLDASNFPRSAHGRTFGAHVHVDRCGPKPTDAGDHYQHSAKGSLKDREVWLDFTVDKNGRARVTAERPWAVKAGAANSVVVHGKATDQRTGKAGDPILCTTVPFGKDSKHSGYEVKSTKDMSKDVRKDAKQAPPKKSDARLDKKAGPEHRSSSPGPRTEGHHEHGHHEHSRDHEGRHHEGEGRHHEGRHHDHGRDYRDHRDEGRHHEGRHHEGRDHEGRDHEGRHHGRDDRGHRDEWRHHDGRDHRDGRDRDHEGRDRHHDGRDHKGDYKGDYKGDDKDHGREHHRGYDNLFSGYHRLPVFQVQPGSYGG
ncbi:hypothetical protein [Actinocorallia aurantiaca]|uniref:Uncharacterized protein n=1 Tax=Actinocorallia aurantiaca TaxID=46204 RepID=A0ABP6GNM5_9ACTN